MALEVQQHRDKVTLEVPVRVPVVEEEKVLLVAQLLMELVVLVDLDMIWQLLEVVAH